MLYPEIVASGVTIVYSSEGVAITWNKGATFGVWNVDERGVFHEVNVFTYYGVRDECKAREVASLWMDTECELVEA